MHTPELEPGSAADSGDAALARILSLLESMDARMSRLEGQVTELTDTAAQAPAVVAGVTDTIDTTIARAAERGVDIDAHVRSSVQLVESLTEPRTVATLSRLLDRLDTVDASLGAMEQLPDLAAGAVDTVDRLMGALASQGIDVDARLRASLVLAEKLTDPTVVESALTAVDALSKRAPALVEALEVADQLPGLAAGAMDTLDGLIAGLQATGVDLDARLRALTALVDSATRPETVAAIERLLHNPEALHQLAELAEQGPGLVAGTIDTLDGLMAGIHARGIDVHARTEALLLATEAVTDPAVLQVLTGLAERAPQLEEALQVADQLPGLAAGAMDTLDGVIAGLQRSGVDLDARLRAVTALADAATKPESVAALERLLSNPEALHQLADLAEQGPGLVAGTIDTLDGLMARLQASGIQLDERLGASLTVLEKATRPEALAAVGKLLENTDQLADLADFAEQAPGIIAGTIDTLDGLAARVASRGIDLDQRLMLLVQAVESLTDPVIVELLQTVLCRGPELRRLTNALLESGVFDQEAVDVVGSTSHAVVATRAARPAPVGAFGALGAVFDPDVQKALGFAIQFAKTFGRRLDETKA